MIASTMSRGPALRPFQFAALAFLCLAPAATAADQVISPLATARPIVARHGMVVTQEAAASRVGLNILKRGGNAVDAAVAVGFALAVTLPRAGNLGGSGFMLIHRADLKQTIAIDYRETAPAATTKDVFLDANGKSRSVQVPLFRLGDRRAWNRRRPRARQA
jgi:gamma-glutamyltranspeptidase/glutathione hydrolase